MVVLESRSISLVNPTNNFIYYFSIKLAKLALWKNISTWYYTVPLLLISYNKYMLFLL
jgi:hypothetical protein